MERNVLKERMMNKDDKNRHFVLLIIDISKHGATEMGNVKMAGPGFVFEYSNVSLEAVSKPFYGFSKYMCNSVEVVKKM
jgi:hypothetical protein